MDCKTGTLVDLSKSPESKLECKNLFVSSCPSKLSLLGETSENFILNKQLNNALEKIAHNSPQCGVLIDLDFSGLSPNNGSDLGEALVQSHENSRFAEENNSGSTLEEKSNAGSMYLKIEKGSSTTSSNGNDFSWSPSIICTDTDLLENEEFDFKFMSSISPDRGNVSSAENVCQTCAFQNSHKKLPMLSTPRKDWSILNDAFISQISEEAAKVVTHLSAKKVFPSRSKANAEKILPLPLNSSFSVTEPNDLDVNPNSLVDVNPDSLVDVNPDSLVDVNPDSLLGSDDVSEYNPSKNRAPDNFLCASKNNALTDAECVRSENELADEIMEFTANSDNRTNSSSENKCKTLDDCIMLNLNAVGTATSIVNVENIIHSENKENIPIGETEISVFSNDDSSDEASNSIVNTEKLTVEEQLSLALEQKCEISNSSRPSKELSPLIRRETFTLKTNPLQESNKSTLKNKTVNNFGDGKNKGKFTPKNTVRKIQHSLSFNNSHSLPKKTDPPSHSTLTREETYTIDPGMNPKNLLVAKNQTSSGTSHSTPKGVSRIASFAGKIKSLSSKVTKSKSESSADGKTVSSSKSPKSNSASTFKTPIMAKRTSLLPSKFSDSQSRGGSHSKSKAISSSQQQSPAITKSNSFRLSSCTSLRGPPGKKLVQSNKPRASSEGEITDSVLGKRSMPVKAIAPVSNMVKATSGESSGANIANVYGNKGKTTPSSASQGLRSGRINAVHMSEPAKCSSSRSSTPKTMSTPSRPRFSSQGDSTPTSVKTNAGVRRFSFVPTPTKHFTPKRSSEKFC